jgi:hypothetical protein
MGDGGRQMLYSLLYAVLLGLARAAAYSVDAWRARRLATVRGGDQRSQLILTGETSWPPLAGF